MDPEANLKEQRTLAEDIIDILDDETNDEQDYDVLAEVAAQAMRLAELVQAMDQWMSRGGFMPSDWAKGR